MCTRSICLKIAKILYEMPKVTKVLTHLIHQDQLEVCMKDWAELADEYRDLELRHKEYREVLSICNTHKRKGKIKEISCADLGEMHGPTEEVYQRSHTSGPSAFSRSDSHNFLPEIPAWSDQEAGQGDRGEP